MVTSSKAKMMNGAKGGEQGADDAPVTTTKALLVQIVAPCKFKTKKDEAEEAHDAATAAISTTSSDGAVEEPVKIPDKTPDIVERAVSNETKDLECKQTEEDNTNLDEEGGPTLERQNSSMPTEEEAALVQIRSDDPEDAIVNVEELLRITFSSLAADWHLLNVPTYTNVRHFTKRAKEKEIKNKLDVERSEKDDNKEKSSAVSAWNILSQASRSRTESDKVESKDAVAVDDSSELDIFQWIQITVMARPSSLAIILDRLDRIGVGTEVGTVSVYNCELCVSASPYAHMSSVEAEAKEEGMDDKGDKTEKATSKDQSLQSQTSSVTEAEIVRERAIEAARAEWKNAATRLRIEQVREQISEQAAFSFDFIALLTVASILAGVGLITDNTVVIVASMLVSPIMGPVLGLTFGSRIQDWPLVKISFVHETLALAGCVVIGALVGLGAGFTKLAEETWPTNEMQIRGEATGLLTGIAIAIPSGMGVCLSILGGNTSSLVGVAISASLLPPAVNAGICFVYSIFLKADWIESDSLKTANEFAKIGAISYALTVVNIFCIWVSGLVMFEIKEVAPAEKKSAFWAKDIKIARELNKGKNEKPPPVNVNVIRQGVLSALNRKRQDSEKPLEVVKFQRPPKRKKPVGGEPVSLDAALQLKSHRRGGGSRHRYTGSWWAPPPELEEEVDENVRYVGLEDMAKLLGFDEEDEDAVAIDYDAVARGLGRGRYL